MTTELEVGLYIFMLAGFLGYHIITRVPPLLHTPLMSATNAIAAISLVGSLVVAGSDYSNVPNGWVCTLLGFVAVTCSATNAFGGFLITDRMLRMFKTAEDRARRRGARRAAVPFGGQAIIDRLVFSPRSPPGRRGLRREHSHGGTALMYSSRRNVHIGLKAELPKSASDGMLRRLWECSSPCRHALHPHMNYRGSVGCLIGAVVGGTWSSIPRTAVPQRTALSH